MGLSEAVLGESEITALKNVINSGWITQGELVASFEKAFSNAHFATSNRPATAVAVSSCTAALHLALVAGGIRPGDEVLVPSLTFVAAANTIVQAGATPVFVDITSIDCPHIDIEDAKAKLTKNTKAVIVMDYGGYVVDGSAWRSFAEEHDLLLIDDAAHAAGMEINDDWADFTVYSFFGNKNMTTAEGGMICASDSTLVEKCRRLRSHGMTSTTLDRKKGHAYSYDVERMGFNYRLDELRASIGMVQLEQVARWNETRRSLTDIYRRLLANDEHRLSVPFSGSHRSACHILPVLLPENTDRPNAMEQLRGFGIQSSMHYPPIHTFSYYREMYSPAPLPRTEEYCQRELTLPLHPSLSEDDVSYVVESIRSVVA